MPAGLKVKLDDYSHGYVGVKDARDEETDYVEMPVTRLEIEMVAGRPVEATLHVILRELDFEASRVLLKDVTGTTIIQRCLRCRERLEFDKEIEGWRCGCNNENFFSED